MHKRGSFDERLYLWLFYIVLILLTFVYFYGQVNEQITFENFKKDLYARDIALISDSLHESYFSYNLNYSFDKEYNVNFGNYIGKVDDARYYYFNPEFNLNLNTDKMEFKNE